MIKAFSKENIKEKALHPAVFIIPILTATLLRLRCAGTHGLVVVGLLGDAKLRFVPSRFWQLRKLTEADTLCRLLRGSENIAFGAFDPTSQYGWSQWIPSGLSGRPDRCRRRLQGQSLN